MDLMYGFTVEFNEGELADGIADLLELGLSQKDIRSSLHELVKDSLTIVRIGDE